MRKNTEKSNYEETIEETMFLTGALLRDEEAEDRLFVRFYREETRTPAPREETSDRLIRAVHRTLASDAAYGAGDTKAKENASADADIPRSDWIGTLIASYYRDKRASFTPDGARIARLAAEIDAA